MPNNQIAPAEIQQRIDGKRHGEFPTGDLMSCECCVDHLLSRARGSSVLFWNCNAKDSKFNHLFDDLLRNPRFLLIDLTRSRKQLLVTETTNSLSEQFLLRSSSEIQEHPPMSLSSAGSA